MIMKTNTIECRTEISRRSFLVGGGTLAAAVAAFGLAGCAETQQPTNEYLPSAWDHETDIVVVGYGGAGAAAAIAAKQEDLGDAIVLEAAPEEGAGGNTRVSGNLMFIPDEAAQAIKYQSSLNGAYKVEDDLLQAWADELVKNKEWVEGLGGDVQQMPLYSPEFPDSEGSEAVKTYCVDGEFSSPSLWNLLKEQESELDLKVLYNTRATKLVFNPVTKEVFGVIATDESGTEKTIKARKGVVLSCGGFENNLEMMQTYGEIGISEMRFIGTPFNRGDGFAMIEPLGAKLWHMSNMAGNGFGVRGAGSDFNGVSMFSTPKTKDFIFVGPDGKRFMYEEKTAEQRHGKVFRRGAWLNFPTPTPTYCIFGEDTFTNSPFVSSKTIVSYIGANQLLIAEDNQGLLEEGIIIKADTIEELAEKIGYTPEVLKNTLDTYNTNAQAGSDPEFDRGTVVHDSFVARNVVGETDEENVLVPAFDLTPIEGPFYAIELVPRVYNTQGGPKRTGKGEVTDGEGVPIPRLCAAGEFGCVYSYMYNGGGNVSEAISSGRIAARTIGSLEPWDAGSGK